MKADFHSLQMPTQNFGVSWSTKPPFRHALHCGQQRVFKKYFVLNREIDQIVLKVPSDFLTGYENLGQKSYGGIKVLHIDPYGV